MTINLSGVQFNEKIQTIVQINIETDCAPNIIIYKKYLYVNKQTQIGPQIDSMFQERLNEVGSVRSGSAS